MSSVDGTVPAADSDLQEALELRKTWFYECQLRHLNYDMLRDITGESEDPLLQLISEPSIAGYDAGQFGQRPQKAVQVYLDNQQPVWSDDERTRRGAFGRTLSGDMGDWFAFKNPKRLAQALAELKKKYEQSAFGSLLDLDPALGNIGRKDPGTDVGSTGRATSRAMLANAKPWLIPELYNAPNADAKPIANWIVNLERFIKEFETEMEIVLGGIPGAQLPFDVDDSGAYRAWIKFMMTTSPERDAGDSVKVRFLEQVRHQKKDDKDKGFTYFYDLAIGTSGAPMGPVSNYPLSERVKYWKSICESQLGDVYVSAVNADMGMCNLIRLVYLFGTLPASLGKDEDLPWRKRSAPVDAFERFVSQREADLALKGDADLLRRFRSAKGKLKVILEESAAHPRSASPAFSVLFQEVLRQGIRSFKFWMDEPLRAKNGQDGTLADGQVVFTSDKIKAINAARSDTGKGGPETEMEYWSENHYIMFASSEYLAGQLWEADSFQPGKEFLEPGSKSGILSGKQRKERGRARVLKWLNNRLQFGWMEFNSTGYYREHLWALLNLADFALDAEVRDKAKMALDLLLFDIIRFQHKGTMGAPGGRSQFHARASGWDNRSGDVVEIMLGTRGIFLDGDGQIGSIFASSPYRVPDVLLQIGVFPPPAPFFERARVSITFDEAPRHGIGYSMKSDQKDSVMQGYASKVQRFSPFVDSVNREIARSHNGYGKSEDDTVLWLTMSAFFIKQTVRDQMALSDKFDLDQSGIFKKLPGMIKLVDDLLKVSHGGIGAAVGGALGGPVGAIVGGALGYFEDKIFNADLMEAAADDLSVLLEGSTRTRANIQSYRTPDVMLTSLQNFRPGQLNFQSCSNQVTLNASTNVFTNAPFGGIAISEFEVAAGGGLLGAGIGLGLGLATGGLILAPIVGTAGAAFSLAEYGSKVKNTNPFGDDDDGPGWWTGSWALPMTAQYGSAAILIYDYAFIEKFLANVGSHVWFPKSGFDRVVERRTSAYDDANSFLLDITDIGPKGFWLFGKVVHPKAPGQREEAREAYVGVFSNQRPKWLDRDSDLYQRRLKEQGETPISDTQGSIDDKLDALGDKDTIGYEGRQVIQIVIERSVAGSYSPNIAKEAWLKAVMDEISVSKAAIIVENLDALRELAGLYIDLRNLQRIWKEPLLVDYFAERDWSVEGKNVWILQVGSKAEFGDFDNFMDRVSSARIHLDDSGDMECSYDIPKADGSSDRLSLAYGDGGRFQLNGNHFATDLYPRFENPFIRGGRVEWGQREYVIEYNGKSLLHDFSDYSQPVREEAATATAKERNLVKALVIFVRTGDEDMDAFTVANTDVGIGCSRVTQAQVLAAGPVDSNSDHDAEWIFFDFPATRDANMALLITHPASTKGDDTPHWKMSFKLFALMGDRTLRPCSLSYAYFEFVDDKRTAPQFPFSIALFEWRPWVSIVDHKSPVFWAIARQPQFAQVFYDYSDLLAIDTVGRLWHRRLMSCAAAETGWFAVAQAQGSGGANEPDLTQAFFMVAVSAQPATLYLTIQSQATLFARQPTPTGTWSAPWRRIDVWTYPDAIFGIPDTSGTSVPVALSLLSPVAGLPSADVFGAVELTVLGADGHFYSRTTRSPDDVGPWRQISVTNFAPLFGVPFEITADFVFALASDRSLWAAEVDHSGNHITPVWEKVSAAEFAVSRFTVTSLQGASQIVAVTTSGGVRAVTYRRGASSAWIVVNLPGTAASLGSALASAAPTSERAMFFAAGADGKIYALDWEASYDWTPGVSWSEIAPNGNGIMAQSAAGIAAVCRVNGQIEIYAQSQGGALVKAWWS